MARSGPLATGGIEDGSGGVCRPSDGFQYNLPSTFSGYGFRESQRLRTGTRADYTDHLVFSPRRHPPHVA
jgi:hypothetical protein